MSDIIQVLPDSVANQIAAGEVIQRPASVIKELVENAVDAEADTINVIVIDAGRTSIQVIDNGKGMSETDARLSFERHATSKIRKADDLFALHTMGFRGEALASIAAVAQVTLKTRMAADEIGSQINISGGRVTSQSPVSCPVGSNFSVEIPEVECYGTQQYPPGFRTYRPRESADSFHASQQWGGGFQSPCRQSPPAYR